MKQDRHSSPPCWPPRPLSVFTVAICLGLVLALTPFVSGGRAITSDSDPFAAGPGSRHPLPGGPIVQGSGPSGQSTLGDFVWHDTNGNGLQEPDEPGIDLVLIQLYLDNNDGVFDPLADVLQAESVTGNNPGTPGVEAGWYEFIISVTEGFYWVNIDAGNFAHGGPLEGYILTTRIPSAPTRC